jgi:hypothetical protein
MNERFGESIGLREEIQTEIKNKVDFTLLYKTADSMQNFTDFASPGWSISKILPKKAKILIQKL